MRGDLEKPQSHWNFFLFFYFIHLNTVSQYDKAWFSAGLYKRAWSHSARLTLHSGHLQNTQIPDGRRDSIPCTKTRRMCGRIDWDKSKRGEKQEIEDRGKLAAERLKQVRHSHSPAPFKHSSGSSLLLHSCCTANSRAISQLCASQGKRVNRAVQSSADAEDGQSLQADLPYASFTSVVEEGFIKGLFRSVTFDLARCLP